MVHRLRRESHLFRRERDHRLPRSIVIYFSNFYPKTKRLARVSPVQYKFFFFSSRRYNHRHIVHVRSREFRLPSAATPSWSARTTCRHNRLSSSLKLPYSYCCWFPASCWPFWKNFRPPNRSPSSAGSCWWVNKFFDFHGYHRTLTTPLRTLFSKTQYY